MKNVLNYILRIGISLLLLWWIFKHIDTEQTLTVVKSADMRYLAVAFLFFFTTYVLTFYRWTLFIKGMDLQAPEREIFRYFCIGTFGNLFLPSAIGGDAIKIVGLCRIVHHKAKVVGSILLDRLSGYAGLVIVMIIACIFGWEHIQEPGILIPILFVIPGTIVVALVLFNEKIYEFCCRIFDRIPKIKNALMQMHYDIALMKNHPGHGYGGIFLSCLSHVCLALLSYFIAVGLHQEVSVIHFLIFFPLISVASALPSLGGLGVREVAAVYFFGKIGIESGTAASITLMTYVFMVVVGLIGGAIYVTTLSAGRVQHPAPDPGAPASGG
ncbi:MAG: flippase-like domain-containing protein [Candidatus Omnitrophica bacterium]|nr:flippase-like domain-containing protein [Candidatus Omnitrophota bacterium]